MAKFDRYLLAQLTMTFGFFALVLVSVYWVNRAVSLFDQLISDGQSAWVFLELTALTLPNVILLVLPVAVFVATLVVINRLSKESELVVMQATGFSSWRLVRPALYFGLIVAALMAVLAHYLVPISRTQLALRQDEISRDFTAKFLNEGRFMHPSTDVTLYIRQITPLGELRDVLLSDAKNPRQQTTYTAKRALLARTDEGPQLIMFDGLAQSLHDDNRLSTVRFDSLTYNLASLLAKNTARVPNERELSTPRLLAASPSDQRLTGRSRAVLRAEGHARLAQPFLAPVLAVLAAAALFTGNFSRLGLTRPIILAVVLMITVQVLLNLVMETGRSDENAWPALYVPVLFGASAGLFLLSLSSAPRWPQRLLGMRP
jgi:lipopolysaccharide export system permease protein